MRLVYVLVERTRTIETADYEWTMFGPKKPRETWQEWALEARLPDVGGDHIMAEIKQRYPQVKVRHVPGGVTGWPKDLVPVSIPNQIEALRAKGERWLEDDDRFYYLGPI